MDELIELRNALNHEHEMLLDRAVVSSEGERRRLHDKAAGVRLAIAHIDEMIVAQSVSELYGEYGQ